MAKGAAAAKDDISDWCEMRKVEAAFRRGIKTGAAASGGKDEATLSALKKIIPKENYDNVQIIFAAYARDKKYLSLKKFTTREFFVKMCKGNEAKAQKLAKKMETDEDAAAAKDAAPKAKIDDVTSRLTDSNKYTGAHKERFDESGKGKGIAGRETLVKNDGYVGNYKNEGKFEKTKNTAGATKADDITKRMTDTSLYTGSHGKRFDADGKGKGKGGREDAQSHTGYTGQYKNEGTYK